MEKMIAACGLICSECPAYIATVNNDEELRIKTAKEWSKMFNAEIKPESIVCSGCLTESGQKFSHCAECKIRECVILKEIKNCGQCDDYACEKITEFFKMAPEAKIVLDEFQRE